jgi:hypothetical protein
MFPAPKPFQQSTRKAHDALAIGHIDAGSFGREVIFDHLPQKLHVSVGLFLLRFAINDLVRHGFSRRIVSLEINPSIEF